MFQQLGALVARRWIVVLLVWAAATALLAQLAPPWDQITDDGDFAYLPRDMTSVRAEQILQEAFSEERSKSQLAFVLFRPDGPLTEEDLAGPGYDMARRLLNLFAVRAITRADELRAAADELDEPQGAEAERQRERARLLLRRAEESLDEAILLDSLLEYERPARGAGSRWGVPFLNRALLLERTGRPQDAALDRELLAEFAPQLQDSRQLQPVEAQQWPLLDLWTWRDETFGAKLRSEDGRARLMVLHLTNEFLEVGNIAMFEAIKQELQAVRRAMLAAGRRHLQVGLSGSAAVGGDLLISSRESIANTELFTVLLVVLILAVVYRSPLLIIVPMATIFVSLKAATALVAMLTQLDLVPGFAWWELKVFTTSKIFIIVIMFGAGTDFCLFLIARCREALQEGCDAEEAVRHSVANVGEAITASALTTIAGLGMMVFADFGKFRFSGPVIGLCLLVMLAACLTLTPALLRLMAPWLRPVATTSESRLWRAAGQLVCARPRRVLAGTMLLLAPLALLGVAAADHVTYDFLASLDPASTSRRGAELMRESFAVGQSGPLQIVARLDEPKLDSREGRDEIARVNYLLYQTRGVAAVRSLVDPLGETTPGDTAVLLSPEIIEARFARHHQRTAELFLAQTPELAGRVTRFEVVMEHDPFSPQAIDVMRRIQDKVADLAGTPGFWSGAEFFVGGTTAGIHDLAEVTQSDTRRIELLVVVAVYLVLVLILRRPGICLYLVATVLLSYYVTVGGVDLLFQATDSDYQGLDWKVPLFLFVILVAVGQDYNVYLVTRVFQEQRRLGRLAGLQAAVERTGGIITSCGVIMAGTFLSMTGGLWSKALRQLPAMAWLPPGHALKGIVQLGVALAAGVLLDTLVVRPVLVPAFLCSLPSGDAGDAGGESREDADGSQAAGERDGRRRNGRDNGNGRQKQRSPESRDAPRPADRPEH